MYTSPSHLPHIAVYTRLARLYSHPLRHSVLKFQKKGLNRFFGIGGLRGHQLASSKMENPMLVYGEMFWQIKKPHLGIFLREFFLMKELEIVHVSIVAKYLKIH